MFLKRFEAKGFKSFADHTIINFQHSMIGIVGPNGSGKSNIVDGLKWVLGEQSFKQLRGKQSSDFIFSGSDARDPANFAEVSLTFDNQRNFLKTSLKEITITRKLTRGLNKNEYFINGEQALLSDIKEIFVDTGLSKGSLGIISQGTVSWFTEAKPIERRKIFEDASGIGKYTLTKKDTLNQLNKARVHLNDAQIVLKEVERQINRLTKQAEKAQLYLAKKEQLQKIEITILAKDILDYRNTIAHTENLLKDKKSNLNLDNSTITEIQDKLVVVKKKFAELDKELGLDNLDLIQFNNELNDLQNRKNILESQLEQQLFSTNIVERAEALNKLISSMEVEIAENELSKQNLENEISIFNEIKISSQKKHEDLIRKLNDLKNTYNQKHHEYNSICDRLADKYKYDHGIKAILSNKNYLTGIYDLLENLIEVNSEHEIAIGKALGKALKNIVVKSMKDAQKAIEFLKKNRAGQATFMPVEELRFRSFSTEHYDILNQLQGFVGMANHLVNIDPKFQSAVDSLLNKIIIASSLEEALNLSKYTNKLYRVITLEGDVISPMGIMSGGFDRRSQNQEFNLEAKREELEKFLRNLNDEIKNAQINSNEINLVYKENDEKLSQKGNSLLVLNSRLEELKTKLKNYQIDYEKYEHNKDDNGESVKSEIDQLTVKLVAAQQRVSKQKSLIETNTKLKHGLQLDIQTHETNLNLLSSNFTQLKDEINELENKLIRTSNVLENATNRLSENYQMTPEFAIENYNEPLNISDDEARSLIRQLSFEIKEMGNINLEAVEELKTRQDDYNYKKIEFEKLLKACEDLEKIIEELNKKAIESFDNIIVKVNEKLPEIFEYLFGGGTCKVVYDLPESILESGIEIHAYLPGKTISNLLLFSGGEKTLIALSVLFAILQVSDLPLVILDEAESALDPANVERFGNIIKKNSNKTQFFTITHRPGTMERCDILYGVTMLIKGISKIVNVELKNAMKYSSEGSAN